MGTFQLCESPSALAFCEAAMKLSEKRALVAADMAKITDTQRVVRDNSARFKLIGGPHHGNIVRLYAPWEDLTFEDGSCYTLTAPLGRSGEWVYVHGGKNDIR